jgi:rhamnulokinase
MSKKVHIAIDLGAESGRVVAGVFEDNLLSVEVIHRFPTKGFEILGTLRWNIYRIFEEIIEGLTICAEKYSNLIASIGVDSWGVDFSLLNRNRDIAFLPYHYRDDKNTGTDLYLEKAFGKDRLYKETGIQLLQINTVNQLAAMKRDNDPVLEYGSNILFIGDLIHYFLCGTDFTEYTIASISGLIDTRTKKWNFHVLDTLDIPRAITSKIIPPGTKLGKIDKKIAKLTSLPENVEIVAPAVHDTASAAVSIPVVDESAWAYISTGTWVIGGYEIASPVINDESCQMNISNSGGVFDTSLFLKNTMGLWIIQKCREVWNTTYQMNLSYDDITLEVEKITSDSPMLIDPDNPVFLNPNNMIDEIIKYLNRTGQGDVSPKEVGKISSIVFTSLACKVKFILDALGKVTGYPYDKIYAIGGGIQNYLFMQMISNITQKPVIAGPVEAASIGNIMMQSYALGDMEGIKEIRKSVSKSFPSKTYEPARITVDSLYSKFLTLIE